MSRESHFLPWPEQVPEEVAPGVRLLARQGRAIEIAKVVLRSGTTLAEHAHPEEQFFFVLAGRLQYRVGEEERVVAAGKRSMSPETSCTAAGSSAKTRWCSSRRSS